jgi:Cu-Zn family superoxide dismutase
MMGNRSQPEGPAMSKPCRSGHCSAALLAAAVFALGACGKKEAEPSPPTVQPEAPAAPPAIGASTWRDARGDFVGPNGEAMGTVEFRDGLGGVVMRVEMTGLSPGWHGVHLHVTADCSDGAAGFKASGGHINPDNVEHGLLNPGGAHRADIPNILAEDAGQVRAEIFRAGVHLKPSEEAAAINGPFPLLDDDGFAVVVHANPDDHMSQPIGGSGDRVACAAIKE